MVKYITAKLQKELMKLENGELTRMTDLIKLYKVLKDQVRKKAEKQKSQCKDVPGWQANATFSKSENGSLETRVQQITAAIRSLVNFLMSPAGRPPACSIQPPLPPATAYMPASPTIAQPLLTSSPDGASAAPSRTPGIATPISAEVFGRRPPNVAPRKKPCTFAEFKKGMSPRARKAVSDRCDEQQTRDMFSELSHSQFKQLCTLLTKDSNVDGASIARKHLPDGVSCSKTKKGDGDDELIQAALLEAYYGRMRAAATTAQSSIDALVSSPAGAAVIARQAVEERLVAAAAVQAAATAQALADEEAAEAAEAAAQAEADAEELRQQEAQLEAQLLEAARGTAAAAAAAAQIEEQVQLIREREEEVEEITSVATTATISPTQDAVLQAELASANAEIERMQQALARHNTERLAMAERLELHIRETEEGQRALEAERKEADERSARARIESNQAEDARRAAAAASAIAAQELQDADEAEEAAALSGASAALATPQEATAAARDINNPFYITIMTFTNVMNEKGDNSMSHDDLLLLPKDWTDSLETDLKEAVEIEKKRSGLDITDELQNLQAAAVGQLEEQWINALDEKKIDLNASARSRGIVAPTEEEREICSPDAPCSVSESTTCVGLQVHPAKNIEMPFESRRKYPRVDGICVDSDKAGLKLSKGELIQVSSISSNGGTILMSKGAAWEYELQRLRSLIYEGTPGSPEALTLDAELLGDPTGTPSVVNIRWRRLTILFRFALEFLAEKYPPTKEQYGSVPPWSLQDADGNTSIAVPVGVVQGTGDQSTHRSLSLAFYAWWEPELVKLFEFQGALGEYGGEEEKQSVRTEGGDEGSDISYFRDWATREGAFKQRGGAALPEGLTNDDTWPTIDVGGVSMTVTLVPDEDLGQQLRDGKAQKQQDQLLEAVATRRADAANNAELEAQILSDRNKEEAKRFTSAVVAARQKEAKSRKAVTEASSNARRAEDEAREAEDKVTIAASRDSVRREKAIETREAASAASAEAASLESVANIAAGSSGATAAPKPGPKAAPKPGPKAAAAIDVSTPTGGPPKYVGRKQLIEKIVSCLTQTDPSVAGAAVGPRSRMSLNEVGDFSMHDEPGFAMDDEADFAMDENEPHFAMDDDGPEFAFDEGTPSGQHALMVS